MLLGSLLKSSLAMLQEHVAKKETTQIGKNWKLFQPSDLINQFSRKKTRTNSSLSYLVSLAKTNTRIIFDTLRRSNALNEFSTHLLNGSSLSSRCFWNSYSQMGQLVRGDFRDVADIFLQKKKSKNYFIFLLYYSSF